jgi:hypothetical protein
LFQPVPVSCKTSKEGSSAEFIHAAVPGFILYNIMEVVVAFLRSKLKSPRRIVAVFFPHVQIHSNPRSDMKSIKTFSVKYELQIRWNQISIILSQSSWQKYHRNGWPCLFCQNVSSSDKQAATWS